MVARARKPAQRPGDPRFTATPRMAAAVFDPPPRNPPAATWTGTLTRADDGSLSGELRLRAWVLLLSGQGARDSLALRMWVGTAGDVLPEFEDRGLGADLWAGRVNGSWPFTMAREDGAWRRGHHRTSVGAAGRGDAGRAGEADARGGRGRGGGWAITLWPRTRIALYRTGPPTTAGGDRVCWKHARSPQRPP